MSKLLMLLAAGLLILWAGRAQAERLATEAEYCGGWVNCDAGPPSFDGVCCRVCYVPSVGHKEWVCVRVSNDIGLSPEVRERLPREGMEGLPSGPGDR